MPSSKRFEVTQPRRGPPRRILVTTELPKVPKKAGEAKSDGKKEESSKKPESSKPEDAAKPAKEAPSTATMSKDISVTEKLDGSWAWTADQDAQLLKLKRENVSWKEIAQRMSLAKSDIQVRFKELQKKAAETAAVAAKTVENGNEGAKGKEKEGEKDCEKDGQKDGGEDEQVHEQEGEGAGSGRHSKQACANCGRRRLRPDDNWSRDDCELLEMLEARYREEEWLSLQSSFFNFTGRMIRADIIERKFSEA